MKLRKIANYYQFTNENKVDIIRNTDLSQVGKDIEGGFLDKEQVDKLTSEIESKYITDSRQTFDISLDDIRMKVFNYDAPIASKVVNGVDLRIVDGLIRNKRKTYLLYANGDIIGEFYSINDIKKIIDYIESKLI